MKRETPHDSRQGADEFAARAERLALLRARFINPYPSQSGRTSTVAELRAAKTSGTREATIAGRIRSIRSHGGSTFAHLEDGTGPFQIYLKQDELKKGAYELFTDTVDVGDFVEARGAVFKTKRGEDTLLVKQWGVLAKALRPLPEKWHGLQDVEARFRKRHLDLITNQEVRSRMVLRSRVIDSIRATMQEYDFLEVETPTLQPVYGGGFARPFKTRHNALGADFYLRISNEMYLKRLLVGGFERVYEITKVFRNEGIDHNHNPEFTMFEAQAAYQDYTWGMDLFEEIVERAAQSVLGDTKIRHHETTIDVTRPWKRMRVTEAIKSETGVDVLGWKTLATAKKDASRALAKRHPRKRALRTMASIGEVIAFVFEALVEERLVSPTIIYDYPVEVSPLAKRGADPRFAERFEGFALGSELGNNYSELNDPIDLAQRFVHEKKRSEAGFAEAHQADADYVEAIAHGMPPACGLGIGVDRLVMLLTGAENIKEVILFPTLRPKETG